MISTVKNIYDSYFPHECMIVPPDEKNIETIDMLLHIDQAVDYFYHFLMEQADAVQ